MLNHHPIQKDSINMPLNIIDRNSIRAILADSRISRCEMNLAAAVSVEF
jgi:hypothetical protein